MWNFYEWWELYRQWYAQEASDRGGAIGPEMGMDWARLNVHRNEDFAQAQHVWEKEQQRAVLPPARHQQAGYDVDVPGYEKLRNVLERAYDQAAVTKGAERHANDRPFHEQPMQAIADRRGIGFILGQVDKKTEEGQGMIDRGENEAAVRELLGAIVYLAGAVIFLEK